MNTFHLNRTGILYIFVCMLSGFPTDFLQAQLEVTSGLTPPFTPENLISNIFLGDGVEVIDITFEGNGAAVGYFTDGLSDTGIDRGLLMSSGVATSADDANAAPGTTGMTSGSSVSDPDLSTIANADIQDVVKYEITFIPTADTLRFRYAFASEEYPEYTCTQFNDAFGFFISGPGINGPFSNNAANIALVPDPNDPTGTTFTNLPVTINNIHNGNPTDPNCTPSFPQYYNDNEGSMTLTYDAILDVFIAQAIVIPCETYRIKLALCDRGDSAFDSAVFLEAKSFGTGSLEVLAQTLSLDGTITEGCVNGSFSISLPNQVESDYPLDYTIIGNAENGVDYEFIPEDLFIPAGDSAITIPVIAFEDGIDEGVEVIQIDIQRDPCNRDTFNIFIRDNSIVPVDLGPDQILCQGNTYALDGTLPVPLPDPPTFTNETDYDIITISNNMPPTPGMQPTISEIQVFGVQPPVLQAGVIKRICLNVDHNWISDIDAFLVSPGGQFIELTTDNGGSGNDYASTCFTPVSTDSIDFGGLAPATAAPFTGDWAPEGVWSDLYDGDNPTNGSWQLQILDDQTGFNGVLLDWSICFNPIYQISYEWFPVEGLSCSDCPDPIASPDTTTVYTLVATDTYGCSVTDSVRIEVLPNLALPNATCDQVTTNSISVSWDSIPGAIGYEVQINGGGWIPANLVLGHQIANLAINQSVNIQIRAFNSQCIGLDTTLVCTTLDCTPPAALLEGTSAASCLGIDNGTVQLSATGTEPPYVFTLDGQTNSTGQFTDLAAGNYMASITDNLGCVGTLDISIGVEDSITLQGLVLSEISCFREMDGQATIEIDGGTGPFAFSWSGGQTDSIIQALDTGFYQVVVTDLNGCQGNGAIQLDEPEILEVDLTIQEIRCHAANDGALSANASGGTTPYTYNWSFNGMNSSAPSITDLAPGSYFLELTDANGCRIDTTIVFTEVPPLSLSLTPFDVNCFGESNGAIQVNPSGGTGNFTFDWADLPGGSDPDNRQNLSVGTYSLSVTDSNGCIASGSITIEAPAELQASATTTTTLCSDSQDGSAILSVEGGVYPYVFSWSDDPAASDSVRTDLSAVGAVVTVTDANGCSTVLTPSPGSPEALELIMDSTPSNCSNDSTGTASVSVAGGIPPYSIQWDQKASLQTDTTAIGLTGDIYSVTVTDANGCSRENSVEVSAPSEIMVQTNTQLVDCFGAQNGEISLNITGGTAPFLIQWEGPGGYQNNGSNILNLNSGNYVYRITDANGCETTGVVEITEPLSALAFSLPDPDSICFGQTNGTVAISQLMGGTPPYAIEWNTGSNQEVLTDLSAGSYFVTITDDIGCSLSDTAFVIERPAIELQLSQQAARCADEASGSAAVAAIDYGGTAADLSDYSYSWSTTPVQTGIEATGLIGGQNYEVVVEDAFGCQTSASVTLDNPEPVRVDVIRVQDVGCFGDNNGQIIVQGTGGIPPYTFQWSPNANGQLNDTITNLLPGDYLVTLTDANGCSNINEALVEQTNAIELRFIVVDPPCWGARAGIIQAEVIGGVPPYTFAWSNGANTSDLDELKAGEYFITVTDSEGCVAMDSTRVFDPERLEIRIDPTDLTCFGSQDGRIQLGASGGTPPYQYQLNQDGFGGGNVFSQLSAGEYRLTVRDAEGCENSEKITLTQADLLVVDAGPDINLALGDSLYLMADIRGGTGMVNIRWSAPYEGTLFCEEGSDVCPEPLVKTLQTIRYTVVAIDEQGCVAEDDVLIRVPKARLVQVPTGFSPNGDGNNDRLLVHGPENVQVNVFRIYDRWGELLYEATEFPTNDFNAGWDGTFRGQAAQSGVYTWYVEAEYIDGFVEVLKGGTTLIR